MCGWDHVTPQILVEKWRDFEKLPFDGVGLRYRRAQEQSSSFEATFANDGVRWQLADFEPDLAAMDRLIGTDASRLKHNYLIVNANPGDADWFDDKTWAEISNRFKIAGQIVRRNRLAGIIFDPEPYVKNQRQFMVRAGSDFLQTARKAEQRGREVMMAFGKEAPSARILAYYWLSTIDYGRTASGLGVTLRNQWYELLPSFAEGLYSAMPPLMRVIDGNESAYHYNSPENFAFAEKDIRRNGGQVLSKARRGLYSDHLLVGHGLYLDAYVNPKGDSYYIDGLGGERSWRLGANAESAVHFGDGTVWFWCEAGTWTGRSGKKPWEEMLPGVTTQLWAAREPERILKSITHRNLIDSAKFGQWQTDDSKGTFAKTEAGLAVDSVKDGCWIYSQSVRPSQLIAVRASVAGGDQEAASMTVRWKDQQGQWMNIDTIDRTFGFENGIAEGLVRAPIGAGSAQILLVARQQPGEKAVFTSLSVVLIP